MARWLRILRHRWFDETDATRALGSAALDRITERIRSSEQRHHGEIRVCVEAGLPMSYLWRGATPRERALSLFGKLRVWDTEANNGVLIYVLLAERAIEIVADRGVARHVAADHWQGIVHQMRDDFRAGRHEAGLLRAVEAVEAVLLAHHAAAEGARNVDELPDRPTLI
ncbi:MAG: TPM domain-containing protein [Rubrivivax sp.]|nr:TPM domain-containing protein [Rubrivivax sp.]